MSVAPDADVLEDSEFARPTLAVDFDGVLHDYHGSPAGIEPTLDPESPPVPGAIEWLYEVGKYFNLVILSAFANSEENQLAISTWLATNGFFGIPVQITNVKPAAVVYVDDRGYRFDGPGTFPTPAELLDLQPWWYLAPELPPVEGDDAGELAASVQTRAQMMEPALTKLLLSAAKTMDGQVVGLEDRFKAQAATAGKIEMLAAARGTTEQAAASGVKDGLRYSIVFPDDEYVYGTGAALASLEADGMAVDRVRNYWIDHVEPERIGTYAGINAVLRAPNGFAFEVQFHTPASFRVNQAVNWELYRQTRDPELTDAERLAILDEMRANLAEVPRPDGVEDFSYPGAKTGMTAAAAPARVPASHHTAVNAAAQKRVDALEERLAALIRPILERAGTEAATRFRSMVTDHMTACAAIRDRARAEADVLLDVPDFLTAAGPDVTATSTMVALKPRPDEAEALGGDLPAETLHVTLAYLGDVEDDLEPIVEALRPVAAAYGPLAGTVAGAGFFGPLDAPGPEILLPDVPGLVELRVAVTQALVDAGIDYGREHGFEAHITTGYRDDDVESEDAEPPPPVGAELHFDAILVVRGDSETVEIPLVGVPAITAAGEPTPWTAPVPDEIVDVPALVAKLRTKTDPVRTGFVEATMTPALAAAGLSWDVTNPFTAKVLAQAGSQVTGIAQTTQLNVMRIINESYTQGLSIPDTAKAIQEGMRAAAPARATLIARTELAGAVNGGSLAAASIVSSTTGDAYEKVWLTAPGANYPRHEDYDGLDGQTVALDDYFTVGDSQLQFPGDPDGDPGEVCNCRCALAYEDAAGHEVEGSDAGEVDLG